MISAEEFDILASAPARAAIAANRRRDSLAVALDSRVPHARLVATQVKYLARAEAKLPSYAAAQCILPPLAFEQASSEECAAHKNISGERLLDLTCGLGVDTFALSKRFRQVTSLERNPVLARITAYNLRLLGVDNVEVVCASAEEFLADNTEKFDWIFADPDRRNAEGRKLVRLEECSPDILALKPLIDRASAKLCVKNSPLFDVDEAFRLFPQNRVEVVSLGDECKEVTLYINGEKPRIAATALEQGCFEIPLTEVDNNPCGHGFQPEEYGWLVVPDVALRKARLACHHLRGKADIWNNDGYGFAAARPEGILGRIFAIESIEPYDPKHLKRALAGGKAEILKRDFPATAAEIARRLGIREGGTQRLAFTTIQGRFWVIQLK